MNAFIQRGAAFATLSLLLASLVACSHSHAACLDRAWPPQHMPESVLFLGAVELSQPSSAMYCVKDLPPQPVSLALFFHKRQPPRWVECSHLPLSAVVKLKVRSSRGEIVYSDVQSLRSCLCGIYGGGGARDEHYLAFNQEYRIYESSSHVIRYDEGNLQVVPLFEYEAKNEDKLTHIYMDTKLFWEGFPGDGVPFRFTPKQGETYSIAIAVKTADILASGYEVLLGITTKHTMMETIE
jgi:hypothetical protein